MACEHRVKFASQFVGISSMPLLDTSFGDPSPPPLLALALLEFLFPFSTRRCNYLVFDTRQRRLKVAKDDDERPLKNKSHTRPCRVESREIFRNLRFCFGWLIHVCQPDSAPSSSPSFSWTSIHPDPTLCWCKPKCVRPFPWRTQQKQPSCSANFTYLLADIEKEGCAMGCWWYYQRREWVCATLFPWSSRINANGIRLPGDTQGRGVDKQGTQDVGQERGQKGVLRVDCGCCVLHSI